MRRFAPFIFCVIAPLLYGCGGGRSAQLHAPHVPLSAAPLPDAIEDTYDIPLNELEEVMRFAMWNLHWGPMKIKHESQGLTASAVRPNGRTVEVHGQLNDAGRVRIQVVADRWGNEKVEREFHRELAASIERWRKRKGKR